MISSSTSQVCRSGSTFFAWTKLFGLTIVIGLLALSPSFCQDEKTISTDFRAIDVVQAAQLVANHFSLNLIVLDGVEGAMELKGTAMKRQDVFKTIEKNSGFPVLDASPWMIVLPAGPHPLQEKGLPSSTLPEIAPLAETVSMDFRNTALTTIVTLSAKKAGLELKLSAPIHGKVGAIRIVDQPVREVLRVLEAVSGLRFSIIDTAGSKPILEVGK